MSPIGKFTRQKRFLLRSDCKATLHIETSTGIKLPLSLKDCSLTGLSCEYSGEIPTESSLTLNCLVPYSKLVFDDNEITLGRLVLRRLVTSNEVSSLAFSTVDNRVPIDGKLSKLLDIDLQQSGDAFSFELSPEKFSLRNFLENSHTNVDLFDRMAKFKIFNKEWRESPKYQYYNIRKPSKGTRINLQTLRKGMRNDYIVMASNDYLGFSTAPEVIEAAKKALDEYGFGSTGSPLTTGLTEIHEELAQFIAGLLKKEKVILFNSGYTANVGAITGLTSAQDLIVADILSHASLQDGLQMAQATSRFFLHNDTRHLAKILREARESHHGSLVVTEGVFSMDGDIPPLRDISKLAKEYKCRLFLDEAHSLGVVGPNGLGCSAKYPDVKVDVLMGTFSKICGGIGGFIAADESVIDWLNFYARSYMFSVSIPPSTAAAALAAFKLFVQNKQIVENLQKNIRHFVTGLRHLGCPISEDHESAVIPLIIGDEEKLGIMNKIFREDGVYVIPVTYPAVSKTSCRFRFTAMSAHTTSDLDYVLNVIEKAMLKANFSFENLQENKKLKMAG